MNDFEFIAQAIGDLQGDLIAFSLDAPKDDFDKGMASAYGLAAEWLQKHVMSTPQFKRLADKAQIEG